jgi:hypothetical protein
VNAARGHLPLGERADVSAVVASDDAITELRAAARARVRLAGTDFALVGAYRGEGRNTLVGLDVRGTFGIGFWVEAAYLLGTNPHEEVAAGIDYSFPILERAVLFAQYYRNGAGQTGARPLPPARLGFAPDCRGTLPFGLLARRDPFVPFTRGRDYAIIGTQLGVLPELAATAVALQNLNDGTAVVVPTVIYGVRDWLDLAVSVQAPFHLWGRGGELDPRPEDLLVAVDVPGVGALTADLSGLVPATTLTLWTRASF